MKFRTLGNMALQFRLVLVGIALASVFPLTSAGGDQPSGVSLDMSLAKPRLYLGESTTVNVTLKLQDTSIRNIGYPVLSATGATISGFASPRQSETQVDGATTVSYVFSATVTPRRSGVIQLGPARIDGEILVPAPGAAGFYGELTSKKTSFSTPALDLTVLPLPTVGRPKDFSGTIGRFDLSMSAQPTSLQVGDPVTVTTVINGVGNINTIKCPDLTDSGFKNYPPRSSITAGGLRCEQVLIPTAITSMKLPQVHFSFFDPGSGRYHTLQNATILLALSDKATVSKAAIDSHTSQPLVSKQKSRSWFWLLLAIPAIAVVLLLLLRKRSERNLPTIRQHQRSNQHDISYHLQTAEQALACHDVDIFYNAVFRAAEIMLADQEIISSQEHNSTSGKSPDKTGTKSGTPKIHELNKIITACDAVRYGCHLPESLEMQELLTRLSQHSKL